MKKVFLTVAVVVAIAVSASAQIKVSGTAGLNLSSMVSSYGSKSETSDSKAGLKLGVLGEYSFSDYLGVQAGLVFSQKGGAYKDSGPGYSSERKTTLNYLQIPVNAVGRYKLNDDFAVTALAGPYVAFALSGKFSEKEEGQDEESEKIKFGSGSEEMKALDFGLTLGAGVEYKAFFLRLEYDWGLSNLSNDSGDSSLKTSNFGVSVGYSFSMK
jgi:opacity protein-like surface antigen